MDAKGLGECVVAIGPRAITVPAAIDRRNEAMGS